MGFDYSDIRPYSGSSFEDAICRFKTNPKYLNDFTSFVLGHSVSKDSPVSVDIQKRLWNEIDKVHSCDDFQKQIICDIFLNYIEEHSIDKFTYDIKVRGGKPCIYISTHRDIILDTALLDLALYRSNELLCQMVVGDNLLVNRFTTDMFKVTGGITVRRNLNSATDLRNETIKLSTCIVQAVTSGENSVWIAQKSGRSKDGIDNTNAAILKMLYMSARENGLSFSQFLSQVDIVPVAISYQFDPCDVSKSHQQIRKEKEESNAVCKKKYEDLIDMVRGLRDYKGNVHIQTSDPISSDISSPAEAVREIDRQIHASYRLWNSNYYAYDLLNSSSCFSCEYSDFDGGAFMEKYKGYSEETVRYILSQYANPVRSMLNENI